MGRSRYRILKHGVGVKWDPRRIAAYVPIQCSWFWTPFSVICLLKLWFFMNHLSIETHNKCYWIWHVSNPKYAPLKQFWCIFASQKINKMWNYCLKLWFFRNCLLQRLETCSIGISMPWTLNTCHSSHFYAFFPVKITKCEILAVSWTPPDKKLKNFNLHREKVFANLLI